MVRCAWTDLFSPEQPIADRTFPSRASPFYGNQYHWTNVPDAVKSPTRLVAQRVGDDASMLSGNRTQANGGTPIATTGDWNVLADYYPRGQANGQPVGYYCVVQQPVKLYVTMAYLEALPNDFSGTAST